MTLSNMRPLSFGEILDGAFTLYRRNFLRFVGTSALLVTGMTAAILLLGLAVGRVATVLPASLVSLVLAMIVLALSSVVWSTLAWQAARAYEGKPAPLGDAFEAALIGAMPLMGSGIIAISGITVAGVAVMMAAVALQVMLEGTGSFALGTVAMPVGLGGVVLVCLFTAARLFAVLPAVVLEEKGPWEAMTRSAQLARGALPRILGLLVVAWLIVTLPSLAVLALTGGLARLAGPEGMLALGTGAAVARQLLSLAVGVLTAPFLPAVLVLLYYDRRVRSEALDVQAAAARLGLARA